ncbi:hypothetical protein RIF29_38250 [Crotalaria pallida]|uniref:RNase H type-1 domain-containing protein n=1 Tax=Crotalaria pallida TaxID=3830 RepID=A0AAN9DYV2_CROPI
MASEIRYVALRFWVSRRLMMCGSAPFNALRYRRVLVSSPRCTRCDESWESGLHVVRDCPHSKDLWIRFGFVDLVFFSRDVWQWIQEYIDGELGMTFLAIVWWAWRWRNMEVLGTEVWHFERVVFRINALLSDMRSCVTVNHHGNGLAREVSCACHVFGALIWQIRTFLDRDCEVSFSHVLREANGCVDVLARMGVASGFPLVVHDTPPVEIMQALARDTAESGPSPPCSSFSVMPPGAKIMFHNFDASVPRDLNATTLVLPRMLLQTVVFAQKEASTSSSHRCDPSGCP